MIFRWCARLLPGARKTRLGLADAFSSDNDDGTGNEFGDALMPSADRQSSRILGAQCPEAPSPYFLRVVVVLRLAVAVDFFAVVFLAAGFAADFVFGFALVVAFFAMPSS